MYSIHIALETETVKVENTPYMIDAFYRLLEDCKVNVRAVKCLPFYPNGVTMCAIIAESHAVMSTWPDDKKFQLDFFCCGKKEKVYEFLLAVKDTFTWAYGEYVILERTHMTVIDTRAFSEV